MDTLWQALKVIAVTAAVVVAAAWAARRAGEKLAPRGRGRHFEVLDSLPLGIQRGLFLVRAGGHLLVLGVSRDSVALLSEIEPSGFGADGRAGAANHTGPARGVDSAGRASPGVSAGPEVSTGPPCPGIHSGRGVSAGRGRGRDSGRDSRLEAAVTGVPFPAHWLSPLWPGDRLGRRIGLRLDELRAKIGGRRDG